MIDLGDRFGDRYLETGKLADLDEAIQFTQQAIDIGPDDPEWLYNLGARLNGRYMATGEIGDLDEGIEVKRKVIDLTSANPKPDWLSRLVVELDERNSKTGVKADLNEAIEVGWKAIHLNSDTLEWLDAQGTRLVGRYHETRAVNLNEAIKLGRQNPSLQVQEIQIKHTISI
ncbi:hypothetical protein GQ44DRAFT_729429 [Phaeosphaeriaceae sp. PMI808]|nr:hypothetical protein GQ44DRAFT_729429 [Phaeosphaeriaceae sp. PMI808]